MSIYKSASPSVLEKIKDYIDKGESVSVSEEFLWKGKSYRQVLIAKKTLKKIETGFLYIDKNENIVDNKNLQRELSRLSYYLNVFFNADSETSIKKALKSDEVREREIGDLKDVSESLKVLQDQGLKEAGTVKGITDKIQDIMERYNAKIYEINLKAGEYRNGGERFNEEILAKLYTIYEEGLLLNYEKIKLLSKSREEYDSIKSFASKKKAASFFNRKKVLALTKIVYTMEYYKRLLSKHENILGMTRQQYLAYIKESESSYMEKRMQLIRKVKL
ncbi:hypothetical protein GOM49_07640 [Clostridium bovifaecis]|uniref:Uncharacterized protein n=1 Tax=Clostridium bovifaecis TaxID=2184719 RepID=A0A6I6EXJ1_9CLOT|nr:hypothetical protein GOM49_07640 [Clostridium bovifaecis]